MAEGEMTSDPNEGFLLLTPTHRMGNAQTFFCIHETEKILRIDACSYHTKSISTHYMHPKGSPCPLHQCLGLLPQ